jgi:hypothetical protein
VRHRAPRPDPRSPAAPPAARPDPSGARGAQRLPAAHDRPLADVHGAEGQGGCLSAPVLPTAPGAMRPRVPPAQHRSSDSVVAAPGRSPALGAPERAARRVVTRGSGPCAAWTTPVHESLAGPASCGNGTPACVRAALGRVRPVMFARSRWCRGAE